MLLNVSFTAIPLYLAILLKSMIPCGGGGTTYKFFVAHVWRKIADIGLVFDTRSGPLCTMIRVPLL